MNKTRIVGWIFILALLTATAFFFFGRQGLYYVIMEQRHRSAQIRDERHTLDSLKQEITKLTSDTAYIERIAREKLGMAKKDERVYKFIDRQK